MLSPVYRNPSFRLFYMAILASWTCYLYIPLDFLSLEDPSHLLSWYILLDGTKSMFDPFIVFLAFDEAAECSIPFLLFSSKLLRKRAVPVFLGVSPFSLRDFQLSMVLHSDGQGPFCVNGSGLTFPESGAVYV